MPSGSWRGTMLRAVREVLGGALYVLFRLSCLDAKTRQVLDWRKVDLPDDLSEGPKNWSRQDYAELAGAYAGSSVSVGYFHGGVLQLVVTHGTFGAPFRFLAVPENGHDTPAILLIGFFELKPEWQGKGIGTRIFVAQAEAAARLGFKQVTVESALKGNSFPESKKIFNGHYTWARLGFDKALPPSWREAQPHPFSGCEMVSHVMCTEAGRRHWLQHGLSLSMGFELGPSSQSWAVLRAYLKEKRIRMRRCFPKYLERTNKLHCRRSSSDASARSI